ncbi:MAG: dicarboxylate/amino acid:cation symporter [Pseudomonadota bacterium]
MTLPKKNTTPNLTTKILIGMIAGVIVGLLLRLLPQTSMLHVVLVNHIFDTIGSIFIKLMKMLVVPLVFVSLVCGVTTLNSGKTLGRIGLKAISLYIFTTAVAISMALLVATLLHIGSDVTLTSSSHVYAMHNEHPTLKTMLLSLIPENPVAALVKGDMIQIIVFALLFGIALSILGQSGKKLVDIFQVANEVFIKLILLIMSIAPYAVFCLIAKVFAQIGFDLIVQLLVYFITIIAVLCLQLILTYGLLLAAFARYNIFAFVKKILPAMLFAFSTSSSNATIPVTLETMVDRLRVKNSIAAFTVPLGATINMDGTAIMQGVATVFIANIYHIPLNIWQLMAVVLTATLASIGAAGVPGTGMFTLIMVLKQAGLPTEGIALIIGVDRLLDMTRSAINVSGDCVITYIIAKSEKAIAALSNTK